ncbi:hypothetical protein Tph_c14980 [Thermacetogenium phaeum DSM 12270]|uniref:DUF3786 domain-containing protein n=1 Tax=Thermacetogenium phaeum (strain ATCC BAA-254 / DSM 26808 / PB) TaxID=1089553 RepID=K4LFA1_THEPS|nr:DUF3786 domain-containing protein [Thermacetogenium phaeum]AFV11706.1 hypothetical protein Tph_c14980 [Thermacetogenium phaeum DSM 12270]
MEMSKFQFKNKSFMNWDVTLDVAQKQLGEFAPENIAFRAGVKYLEKEKEIVVPFLNKEYRVRYPSGEVYQEQEGEVPVVNKILILHYLNSAEGVAIKNRWISFKELPAGQIYINPFHNRAIRPLIKFFGERPENLIKAGSILGGVRESFGDVSIRIPVLPMVPVVYVIWRGDEEFPASGNILFDASAPNYLPTEDYAVLSGMVVFELKKIADQQKAEKVL